MQLSFRQKEKLSDFFGNLAVAWIAGGVIGPFVISWNITNVKLVLTASALASLFFIIIMLTLMKEESKR